MKKPELAIAAYGKVPADSPIKRLADIQVAIDLDSLDRTDEAKKHLQQLITAHPENLEAILAFGTMRVFNSHGGGHSARAQAIC